METICIAQRVLGTRPQAVGSACVVCCEVCHWDAGHELGCGNSGCGVWLPWASLDTGQAQASAGGRVLTLRVASGWAGAVLGRETFLAAGMGVRVVWGNVLRKEP